MLDLYEGILGEFAERAGYVPVPSRNEFQIKGFGARWAKVRDTARGSRIHQARLSDAIVRELRVSNEPTKALARRLGVSPDTVRRARRGTTWSHVQ